MSCASTVKKCGSSMQRTLEQQLDLERDYRRELGYPADYAEG